MIRMNLRAAFSALAFAGCAAVITGCGANLESVSSGTGTTGSLVTIKGTAFGGQQPISGAHVYVFAVGTGGYGSTCGTLGTLCPATSLLTSSNGTASDSNGWYVLTDSTGNFTISSSVSCTAGLSAYLYAYGGNPQIGTGSPSNNTAAGLLAPLGTCTAKAAPPSGTTNVNIDEVTTVVTAYALAGFATDATHISAASTTLAKTGVSNAMATALNIVNLTNGTVTTSTNNSAATVPSDKINALADILASCVNSTGPSSGNCSKLFSDTGTSASGDTAGAAIALAHKPFANVSDLYTLVGTQPVFATSQGTPSDWTLGLQYKAQFGQGVEIYSEAVDSGGNLWIRGTNDLNTITTFAKYSPIGAALGGATVNNAANTINPEIHIAVDSSDTAWAGVAGGLMKVTASGSTLLGNGTCSVPGTLSSTVFGKDGSIYAGQYGTTNVYQYSTAQCTGTLTAPGAASLDGYLAIEPDGTIVGSGSTGSNTHTFKYLPGTGWQTGFDSGGDYVTTDAASNIWKFSIIGGTTNDSLYIYPEAGGSSSVNFSSGGLTQSGYGNPQVRAGNEGVHIDGGGNAWVTVCPNGCGNAPSDILVGVTNGNVGITPSTGLTLPYGEDNAHAVALDGSGNVWLGMGDGTILQFLGLATPVATPILYNQIGVKP